MEGDIAQSFQFRRKIVFQSTPSAWRETAHGKCYAICENISIHSLRMEGDSSLPSMMHNPLLFQSTPSAWRETPPICNIFSDPVFQSTPSAWRETVRGVKVPDKLDISIHSLRMEGDPDVFIPCHDRNFISIHSLRMEGDPYPDWRSTDKVISIHSLRMEGDQSILLRITSSGSFQSTPSAGRVTAWV